MQTAPRVNALRWIILFCLGLGGWGYGQESAGPETGWKADLKRMGFQVPVEELEKGEIVGEK